MSNLMAIELIASKIFEIRGKKVMLDRDLALLYGVSTKILNQAVRRNIKRFPEDFMFQLTEKEKQEVVTICDHLQTLKFSYQLPYVFTQEGVAMLSSVLNSERAVRVNIQIMRAFVKLRYVLSANRQFEMKLKELEGRVNVHDKDIGDIFEAIRQMIRVPSEKRRIKGFGY
jgi:hypothetical protein